MPVSQLEIGMYVCELDRPWLESPFQFQGFPLRTTEDIKAVQETCSYVYVDTEKGGTPRLTQPTPPRGISSAANEPRPRGPDPRRKGKLGGLLRSLARRMPTHRSVKEAIESVEAARRPFGETTDFVRTLITDVRGGHTVDMVAVKEVVTACADQITRNADAMLLLSSIRDKDEYTSRHSINVGILSMLLGHRLGMPKTRLEQLGMGGLLHDVGKIRAPEEVLNKPGRLTQEEFQIIKMHAAQGRDILISSQGASSSVINVAYSHHERMDGSGYPCGLKEDELDLFTRIAGVADTFDAVTSDRVYSNRRTTIEAIKILQSSSGDLYDSELVSTFLRALGLYPPGSIIQLTDGRIGVVIRTNPKNEFRPLVLVFKNAKHRTVPPHYVDLADFSGKPDKKLKITRVLQPDECNIDRSVLGNPDYLKEISP